VSILAYHGVTAGADDPLRNRRRLHVPAGRFAEHLKELRRRWQPLPLGEVIDALRSGRPLPRRAVVVTFDDGYRNVRTVAAPLLARFSVPFTLFVMTSPGGSRLWVDRVESSLLAAPAAVLRWRDLALDLRTPRGRLRAMREVTASLDRLGPTRGGAVDEVVQCLGGDASQADDDRDLLTWDEVREMRRSGADIGAHSDRHERLTLRRGEDVRAALRGCRAALEEELAPGPYAFCYPYGDWDASIAAAVREAGFSSAATTEAGLNRVSQDVFALRRSLIGADDDVSRLRAALSGLRSFWKRGPS
jgi:peptidoglycan/xylan/chitin deacetylase (PgdA/CDA1 family)